MRPRLLLIVMAATAAVVLASIFIRSPQPKAKVEPGQDSASSADAAAQAETLPKPVAKQLSSQITNEVAAEGVQTNTPVASHSEYVQQRAIELMDLATQDDLASLNTILAELTNRDPGIRKAALEATIQFGSRDAIPTLQDAATQVDDPSEKKALLEAAEFLKLPSLTEVMAQRGLKPTIKPIAAPKPAGPRLGVSR